MTDKPSASKLVSRRKMLTTTGAVGALALAGCTTEDDGGDDGSSGGDDSSGGDGMGGDDGSGDDGSSDDGSESQQLSGAINIAGSSTVFPLMSAIAEEFVSPDGAGHSQVRIDISSTGSGGGFSNFFCVGETDFNNASRPIKEEEQQLCADNDVEYIELIAATDALTVVINNNNDFATEMTVEELAQIWTEGEAETWSDVRSEWPDEPIQRYGAADTSGTFDYFVENVLDGEAHTDDYQATEQDNTIAQGVQGSEYAIGYFGFAYWFQNQDQITPVAIDNGNGPVEPSLETAASGEYQPLSRPLFTYPSMSALAKDHVAEFARYFVEQTTNEDLVAGDVGYVPATEETQEQQMQKLEDAIEEAQS